MATTSLWRIRGRIGSVIDYIENPDKTMTRTKDPGGEDASIGAVR